MGITGLYVKLDVSYYEDDAILDISEAAELLYLRALCLAKRLATDGMLTERQLDRIMTAEDDPDADPRTELIRAGLLVFPSRDLGDERYQIRGWFKHNDPVSNAGDRGDIGNHKRWHVGRGQVSDSCHLCRSSQDHPPDILTDIATDLPPNRREEKRREETEREKGSDPPPKTRKRPIPTGSLPDELRSWALSHGHTQIDLEAAWTKMLDWHRKEGKLSADWPASWRTWLGREKPNGVTPVNGSRPITPEDYKRRQRESDAAAMRLAGYEVQDA